MMKIKKEKLNGYKSGSGSCGNQRVEIREEKRENVWDFRVPEFQREQRAKVHLASALQWLTQIGVSWLRFRRHSHRFIFPMRFRSQIRTLPSSSRFPAGRKHRIARQIRVPRSNSVLFRFLIYLSQLRLHHEFRRDAFVFVWIGRSGRNQIEFGGAVQHARRNRAHSVGHSRRACSTEQSSSDIGSGKRVLGCSQWSYH